MPEVIINGSEGRVEGYYYHGKDPSAPIAIVLHPHPEYGGTMNNKVTYALYRTFVSRGFNTMRFNFRGVGKSEGKFSHGEGELSDAASVLDWMQTYNPNARACWVGGFSFGAWVGMQLLMRRPELDGFISVSPPANMYDFSFLAPCPVSGLIVQGDKDAIVSKESVHELAKKLSLQRNIVVEERLVQDADHFYTNKLELMVQHVEDYLDESLGLKKSKQEIEKA
ncbi:alpha/beta hydrolase [Candidatus Nucleicultrix amoebiphila]|jgi:alpha/beta superfamily hydrolase|uniref:Alpha/beta hydrolase n=1 Tax=Candidatus Nucleicultrix amoebiphila FS5 TaxID=1414854 RepID=A0A1W6N5W2_9PROT|nr:alpha/beta hydrolase [Candidatus Nucleicultrix amoebiphila]ARN85223.1 alpha/beta hydrolase [Candidatus Nucleicultrix amoebiphila FS5]